jgi:hypothetical protein
MSLYKLDRNSFKAQSVKEADNHSAYYSSITWKERLQVSAYLNSVAYQYDLNKPPRMDKKHFNVRSLNKG